MAGHLGHGLRLTLEVKASPKPSLDEVMDNDSDPCDRRERNEEKGNEGEVKRKEKAHFVLNSPDPSQ